MTDLQDQLEHEQHAVDARYARLDRLRATTRARLERTRRVGPSGSPQNRSERDAFATLYEDRLAQLDAVEQRLCFGRLDLADEPAGSPDGDDGQDGRDGRRSRHAEQDAGGADAPTQDRIRYIGRIGLTDEDQTSLLTDWRAPAARPFYRATSARPEGVVRRRHLVTRGRTVTGLEDEILDLDAYADAATAVGTVAGEGALLAALATARTGRMGDIVATIQAEQDAVIRSDLAGALVVQGGPGTGKTAVALHRAAYLLYAHRSTLERSGVLVVGPSRTFLRYIDQVLPSLGETGVVAATVAELFPGVAATGSEADEVAEVKGRAAMAEVLTRAVRQRQRVPREATEIRVEGRRVVVRPPDVADAIAKARRTGRPHNVARVVFVREMLHRLADQYVDQLGFSVAPEDRAEVVEELRTTREVRIALNLAWMPLTPQKLVEDLLTRPARLEAAGRRLTPHERRLLLREPGAAWTPADVPLLDEAAELLGEDDQAARAQAAADARRREEELDYARQVLRSTGAGRGLVSAEQLAERFGPSGPVLTTAERAAADRSWTYGHVVVDEAQELSAMAWRMLLRRCPTRSMTIVGDVAQTSSAAGSRAWSATLDPVLRGSWRLAELTVNYRTPRTVARTAQAVARRAGLPVSPQTSARDVPRALRVVAGQDADDGALARVVEASLRELGVLDGTAEEGGRVVVVAAPDDAADVTRRLAASPVAAHLPGRGTSPLDARLAVLTPRETKGLEFDVVVLVEPLRVGATSASDLYVAMTRPTRTLWVLAGHGLPDGWDDGDG